MQNDYKEYCAALERKTGHVFHDKSLLMLALTHPSRSGEMKQARTRSNQRLEFLGDAVLECVVSRHLYLNHDDLEEGELTRMRASLVCEPALCACAKELGLGDYLLLGKGENASGGREKPSILSDAFEALIGAIFLDAGYEAAGAFIEEAVLNSIEEFSMLADGKSKIQELVQKESGASLYYLTDEAGSDPGRFHSVLYINGEAFSAGDGRTKKAAEQKAALEAVKIYMARK